MAALGEQLNNNRFEQQQQQQEEQQVAESRLAASSWTRWLPCPLLCNDRFWGARGVPAQQTMDNVDNIQLVRNNVEQIVVCQCNRSWRFSTCNRSTEDNHGGDSTGDKSLTCNVIVQQQVLGRQSNNNCGGSTVSTTTTGAVLGGCQHARCCA